ncbi:MAG: STAS domain-containing protein [Candidatus Gracilibacteria bacterium]|jgi:anti-anti-sigma factor
MTDVTITIEDLAGTADKKLKVVHVSGQLDESNVDEKIKEVYKTLEANPQNLSLIFDFENLEYMNSKSIGYLTDIYGKITEKGGKVAITKAKPNIADILQVVGLTQLIQLFDTTDAAKTALLG